MTTFCDWLSWDTGMSYRIVHATERRGRVCSSYRVLGCHGSHLTAGADYADWDFCGFPIFYQSNDGIGPQITSRPLLRSFLMYYYYYYYYYYPHHLYAGYLQLYTWNKPCSWGIQCCSCSAFTICATYYYYYYYYLYLYVLYIGYSLVCPRDKLYP